MNTDYEQKLEALFDLAAASNAPPVWSNGKPLKVLSAQELPDGKADPYYVAVNRKDWKTVNAMNDARAKKLIAEWSKEKDLGEVIPIKPEPAPAIGRFHIYSHGELMKRAAPTWIVPGVLPEAELCEVFGESGSGKSFFIYDLFAAIHTGSTWNGIRCRKGRTLIIAAEGATGFRNRAEAYAIANKQTDLPSFIVDAPDLLDATDAPKFVTACALTGPWTAIAIDTRSAVTPGGNENSGEDGGKLIQYCKLLHQKTGALVVLIHHVGVGDKERGRGWTGVKAACDTQILVTRTDDLRAWKLAKQKDASDGSEGPSGFFKLKPVNLPNGDSSCVVEVCDKPKDGRFTGGSDTEPRGLFEEKVAEALRGKGPMSMEQVRDYIEQKIARTDTNKKDQRPSSTGRAVRSMIKKGLVVKTPGTDDSVQWHVQPSADPFA